MWDDGKYVIFKIPSELSYGNKWNETPNARYVIKEKDDILFH